MPEGPAAMKTCPVCNELGIGEHSVSIRLDPPPGESRARSLAAYTRCMACGAPFRFDGPDNLVRESDEDADVRVAWIVPPWAARSLASDFELSWDCSERFFRRSAKSSPELASMVSLIGDLRGVGLGARLRAGQSMSTLILSRARNSGLRPEQQHVALEPQAGGAVKVKAKLARELSFGPVPASYGADLKLVIDALISVPVD